METISLSKTMSGGDKDDVKTDASQKFTSLLRPHLSNYAPASNLAFNEAVKKMRAEGHEIFHLGFGQSPFPVMEGAKKVLAENAGENAYLPVTGLVELRANICDFHQKLDGLTGLDEDLVCVGPGSKELFFLLMNIFNGDIMVLSPTWTTYKPQSTLANQRSFVIPTSLKESWKLTPERLEQTIQENDMQPNKLLVLCNPDNPTGTAYTEEDLIALSHVMRKHNIIVLSDEIYARLHFKGQHRTLAKYYPEGTILASGISKWAAAGGWRLGYSIFPRELQVLYKAVCSAGSHTYSCAAGPVQHAAVWLFRFEDEAEQFVRHTSKILEAVANYCHRELTAVGVRAIKSQGGFYMMPDFEILRPALAKRGITTGTGMCKAIMEEASVALMSGGPGFLRPNDEFTVRLCYINFDGSQALEVSKKHADEPITDAFLGQHCKPLVDAIQALVRWTKKQLDTVQ